MNFENVNWIAIAEHARGIAEELTKATATPVDDVIVAALADALVDELRRRLGPVVMEAEPMLAASEIQEQAAAKGVELSPALIALLQTLGPVLVKLFLDRLKK